jgi:hypothetical protein
MAAAISITAKAQAALADLDLKKQHKNRFNLLEDVQSGVFVDNAIIELKKYAKNEAGDKYEWYAHVEGLVRSLLDARIDEVYVSGCSQLGKTAACTMVNSWLSQRANLRTLWVFPAKTQMEKLVPQQHTPTLNQWNVVNNIRPSSTTSKRNTTTHDVGTGVANFSFDKGASGNKSGADAGTSAVAITADWLFFEEASQFSPGSDKVFHRRLDNGRLVKIGLAPKRYLGTCGGGNGIEALIRKARFEFYPHVDCLECGKAIPLKADGCLLKPKIIKVPGSGTIKEFFDEDMKHHGHFYHDVKNPINTAFFGCPECGAVIPDESRHKAKFRDLKTGCPIEEWLMFWVPDHADEYITVGFWITPLVRQDPAHQLAPAMMRDLMESLRLNDTLQQRFSMPSDVLGGGISRELVEASLSRPYFKPKLNERTIKLVGVDQGRSNAYCAIIEFVYNESLPYRVATLEARRNILFLEPIKNSELQQLCEDFDIAGGLIDHAPSIAEAARLSEDIGICMGVQKDQLMDEYRLATVQDGGEEYDAYFLRYHLTAFRLMRSFHGSRVATNDEYAYQLDLQTNQSIVTHLTDVAWNTSTSKLVKSAREMDDLFFACMFAESAFSLALLDPANFLKLGALDYLNSW